MNISVTFILAVLQCTCILSSITGATASSPISRTMTTNQLYHEESEDVQGPMAHFADDSMNRTDFGVGPLTMVRGWPSTGGFYVLSCDGVELQFLGLDRFESIPRSQDQAEEDAFCNKMRKLGPKWYQDAEDYATQCFRSENEYALLKAFGWPANGGLWVLSMQYTDAYQKGVGRLRNAFTMEERCREIEKLGGVFYPDPSVCPDLDLD